MKFIDLFSGIGGFRSALELSGHECIAYSEIDKYAKQSYQAMYDTENEIDLGDITNISQEYLSHFKQENDIVVGGSPCQSFSLAGSRKGFEDTRGTLFFEYAKVVKETQPKYFLFENVKGMLSHDKGNTIRVVLETFDQLGYYIDFNVFNSKYYDVPQNRERIYIVGKRKDLVDNPKYQEKVKGKKKLEEVHNWAVDNINYVKLLPKLKTEVTTRLIDVLEDEVDEKYYLSDEKTKKLTLDNDLGGKLNMYDFNERDKVHSVNKVSPTLNTMQGGDRQPKIAVREATKQGYAIAEQGDSVNVTYPDSKTRRGRVGKQVAQTLQAGEVNQGVVIDDTQGYDGVRYYKGIAPTLRSSRSGLKTVATPKEESGEVNQGVVMDNTLNFYAKDNVVYDEEQYKELVKDNNDFEVDYIYVEPTLYQLDEKHILLINNDQNQFEVIEIREGYYLTLKVASSLDELNLTTYKKEFGRFGRQAVETLNENKNIINDGMTVNAYNKTIDKTGLSPTLTTRPEGFKTAILPITNGLRIRKLTPLECWRLQGFTDEQFYKAKDSGVSNSQLYKQAGNSVTVNVVDAIVKELK